MQISLQDLRDLKQKFGDKELGISNLTQILSDKLKRDPSYLFLNIEQNFLTFEQFLHILDEYNIQQEKLLDEKMFERPTKHIIKYRHKNIQIRNMFYMNWRKNLMFVLYEDRKVGIMDLATFSIISEFSISNQIYRYEPDKKEDHNINTQKQLDVNYFDRMKQVLDSLSKEVNINPHNLRPRSLDPKLQMTRRQFDKRKEKKIDVELHNDKTSDKSLYITSMAFYKQFIFIGLYIKQLRQLQIEYIPLKRQYKTKDILSRDLIDIPRDIKIVKHRVKDIQLCLVLMRSFVLDIFEIKKGIIEFIQQIRIRSSDIKVIKRKKTDIMAESRYFNVHKKHEVESFISKNYRRIKTNQHESTKNESFNHSFNQSFNLFQEIKRSSVKLNSFHLNNEQKEYQKSETIKFPDEAFQMIVQEDLLLFCNFEEKSGQFYIYTDQTENQDLFELQIKKRVIHENKIQSIAAFDYSQKHRYILFGNYQGAVNIFDLRIKSFVSHFHHHKNQVFNIYAYDDQNLCIILYQDFTVQLVDIMRRDVIQTVETFKDVRKNEIKSSYFMPDKGILFVAGNILECWIARNYQQTNLDNQDENQNQKQKKENYNLQISPQFKQTMNDSEEFSDEQIHENQIQLFKRL